MAWGRHHHLFQRQGNGQQALAYAGSMVAKFNRLDDSEDIKEKAAR
jgi:hypothetical protein